MNVLSLFSGIGGLELGLERAGMTVVGQVEIDEFCRRVLAKHWPEVPRHDDVRTCVEWWRAEPQPAVDLICGGFPCQPFSHAGHRLGVADDRWGWPWMADVIRVVRPRYIVVENVAALLRDSDAFGWLLADLADIGMDAEWGVLSACAVGAPHTRERLFLVAYADGRDGSPWLGAVKTGSRQIPTRHRRARAWRDQVAEAVEASRSDDREVDGSARRLVAMGGHAVVPQVAEHVGRLILAADAERGAAA